MVPEIHIASQRASLASKLPLRDPVGECYLEEICILESFHVRQMLRVDLPTSWL